MGRGNKGKRHGAGNLPSFLSPNNIKPFIDEDLMAPATTPIVYKSKGGKAHGGGTGVKLVIGKK